MMYLISCYSVNIYYPPTSNYRFATESHPAEIKIKAGSSLSLTCISKNTMNKNCTLNWLGYTTNRDKDMFEPYTIINNSNHIKLQFPKINTLNSNLYTCTSTCYENETSTNKSAETNVVVQGINSFRSTLYVDENKIARLWFENPGVWEFKGKTIRAYAREIALNMTKDNEGIYKYTLYNHEPHVYHSILRSENIYVRIKQDAIITLNNLTFVGIEGDNVTISCTATGVPKPVLKFYRDNVELNTLQHYRDNVVVATTNIILSRKDSPSQVYQCKISQDKIASGVISVLPKSTCVCNCQ